MIRDLGDKTISATASPLTTTPTPAAWVMFKAPATNSGDVRIGDSDVSTTRGYPLSPGDTVMFPPQGAAYQYGLAGIFVIGTAADTISISYGGC